MSSLHATLRLSHLTSHNSKDDCWIVVHSKVYDVTRYLDSHPGGSSSRSAIYHLLTGRPLMCSSHTQICRKRCHRGIRRDSCPRHYRGDPANRELQRVNRSGRRDQPSTRSEGRYQGHRKHQGPVKVDGNIHQTRSLQIDFRPRLRGGRAGDFDQKGVGILFLCRHRSSDP